MTAFAVRSVIGAVRSVLAALVLIVVVAFAAGVVPSPEPDDLLGREVDVWTWPAPGWLIAAVVAIAVLGIAVAAVVYPRRRGAPSPESWVSGFRAGPVFHRPLPPRSG